MSIRSVGGPETSSGSVPRKGCNKHANVRRRLAVQCFEHSYAQFVGDALLKTQPVQLVTQQWCDVGGARRAKYQSCQRIQDDLKSIDVHLLHLLMHLFMLHRFIDSDKKTILVIAARKHEWTIALRRKSYQA